MSGLIFKDLFLNKKYMWFFLFPFLLLPGGLISEAANGASQASITQTIMITEIMLMFFAYILTTGIIKNDERKAWSSFIVSTPLAARGQVASKYYFTLIILLAAVFVGYIYDVAATALTDVEFNGLSVLSTLFFVLLFMLAIEIPFSIRFGSVNGSKYRATIIMLLLFAGMVYLLFGDLSIFGDQEEMMNTIMGILNGDSLPDRLLIVSGLFPYFSIVMYYLSYRLSCRSYTKGIETFEK